MRRFFKVTLLFMAPMVPMAAVGCRSHLNHCIQQRVASGNQAEQLQQLRRKQAQASSQSKSCPVTNAKVTLPQLERPTDIVFSLVDGPSLVASEILANSHPFWTLSPAECIRLASFTATEQIQKSDCVRLARLDPASSQKLDKAIELQRQLVENELAASARKALYSLACELALQQLLRESFLELDSLEEMLRLADQQELPSGSRRSDHDILRNSLLSKALITKTSENVINLQLQGLFSGLPAGPLWPQVSLIVDHVSQPESLLVATALANRAEVDPCFATMNDLESGCKPIRTIEKDMRTSIELSVKSAMVELEGRYQVANLTQQRLRLESANYEDMMRSDEMLHDSKFELAAKRIQLNQTKMELAESIRDYFVANVHLQLQLGTAARQAED